MGQIDDLFWQLIEQEHTKAVRYCGRLAGNREDGDDLYHDAVVKAYHGFASLRQTGAFRPWFYRIINNAHKGRFRSGWWKHLLFNREVLEQAEPSEDPTGYYDARRRLDYAMASLSADDRAMVILAELEDWSIAELADLLNGTEGFVKMRLFRARRRMRTKLSKDIRDVKRTTKPVKEQATHAVPAGPTKTE